jgi:hypothetical protein
MRLGLFPHAVIGVSVSCFMAFSFAQSSDKVRGAALYKQTPFGINEKEFLQRQLNAGFSCKKEDWYPGRVCTSTTATLASMAMPKTMAMFIDNRLVAVHVQLPNLAPREDVWEVATAALTDTMMLDLLKETYGDADETVWPAEKRTDTLFSRVWKKTWVRGGNKVQYWRNLIISSGEAKESTSVTFEWSRHKELDDRERKKLRTRDF